jgi:hypothetical protein
VKEGHDFLRDAMELCPDKVPSKVVSCSANPIKRVRIEQDFKNWEANGRVSFKPVGV